MADEEATFTVYADHVKKHEALVRKRTVPCGNPEDLVAKIKSPPDVVNTLCGDVQLPAELEGRLWYSLGGIVKSSNCARIDIDGVEWTLLDIFLTGASLVDEIPALELGELMLAFDAMLVQLRGRVRHAVEFFAMSFEDWSQDESSPAEQRAERLFQFGYLLLTVGKVNDAVSMLLAAIEVDAAATQAQRLLEAILEQTGGEVESVSGTKVDSAYVAKHVKACAEAQRAGAKPPKPPTFTHASTSSELHQRSDSATDAASSSFGPSLLAVVGVVVAVAAIAGGLWFRARLHRSKS